MSRCLGSYDGHREYSNYPKEIAHWKAMCALTSESGSEKESKERLAAANILKPLPGPASSKWRNTEAHFQGVGAQLLRRGPPGINHTPLAILDPCLQPGVPESVLAASASYWEESEAVGWGGTKLTLKPQAVSPPGIWCEVPSWRPTRFESLRSISLALKNNSIGIGHNDWYFLVSFGLNNWHGQSLGIVWEKGIRVDYELGRLVTTFSLRHGKHINVEVQSGGSFPFSYATLPKKIVPEAAKEAKNWLAFWGIDPEEFASGYVKRPAYEDRA